MKLVGIGNDGASLDLSISPAQARREVIVGPSIGTFGDGSGVMLAERIDAVIRAFGRHVYELMLYDADVSCAFELLKAGILSDGMRLSPAVKMDPGEVVSERKRKADLNLADEICDAAIRATNGLDEPIDVVCDDMLSAIPFGCSLTEQTYKWGEGEDSDRLMFDSLVVKPMNSWLFRVDPYMKVIGIRGRTTDGWRDLDPEKFAILTWKKKGRDPRGMSGFAPAYNPWNLKIQQYPEFGEFLSHFADPIIYLTAGENARSENYADPVTGKIRVRSVIEQVQDALRAIKSRTGLALPNGSTAGVLTPGTEGGAYHAAFDRFGAEIFRAIVFSSRPILEAKHGSKADSDAGADLIAMAFRKGRVAPQRCLQDQVYRRWVALNWGPDVARRLTPLPTFGSPEGIAADILNAFGNAFQKGFIDEAQLPHLWDMLGLPAIDQAAMQARIERQKQKQQQPPPPVQKGEPVQGGQDQQQGDQQDGSQP